MSTPQQIWILGVSTVFSFELWLCDVRLVDFKRMAAADRKWSSGTVADMSNVWNRTTSESRNPSTKHVTHTGNPHENYFWFAAATVEYARNRLHGPASCRVTTLAYRRPTVIKLTSTKLSEYRKTSPVGTTSGCDQTLIKSMKYWIWHMFEYVFLFTMMHRFRDIGVWA